jgi:UDP-3-O-[3-hydroxymyristoyl] glucosamine N-acyltransferase
VIVNEDDAGDCPVAALVAADPYLTFARVADVLHPPGEHCAGIHESAVVDTAARIAASAHIGANCVIGEDVTIGEHVYVGPGSVIGARCNIGDSTRLISNVSLVQDVTIGTRCVLHPGCVLGADGFGMARSEDGWVRVPQIGGVEIGDDVEIGANSCVDRGAIDDTIIEDGVRLDNLIQVGHNARIGAHTAIAGMTAQALILKNIEQPGVFSATFGAEEDRKWKRLVARFKRLDSMAQRLRALEKKAGRDER